MALTAAGPSRLAALADSGTMEHLPSPQQTVNYPNIMVHGDASSSGHGSATLGPAAGQRLRSAAASTTTTSDSGSIRSRSTSTHSRERVLGSIFGRRASILTNGRRPKSTTSNRSSSVNHDDLSTSETFEMTPMSRHKKKRIVEDIEKRVDRVKADAALAKWRRWIAEQPPLEVQSNPLYSGPASLHGYGMPGNPNSFESHSVRSLDTPMSPPFLTESVSYSAPSLATHAHHIPLPVLPPPAHIPNGLPGGSAYWNGDAATGDPSTPRSNVAPSVATGSIFPGAQDIYTTESVRALRDVELAIDPTFFGAEYVSPTSRARRLSTHPRVSDMENPFAAIDTLLCRRRIRPLVLELVQALGAYIDAVWSTTNGLKPNPWAGVPMPAAARRASSLTPMSPTSPTSSKAAKNWHSWTLTAVQEAKRRGLISNPPTARDVEFWALEIRYGLRDIDEAVNRRKDLGWAFGEVVIRGEYGDIIPANVFANDGGAGNIPRLLNDLEEALWGDAIPAPTDLAFEHDLQFDPFSVYREGDELIGVESHKQPNAREAELRNVFGDSLSLQATYGRPVSPPVLSPRAPNSPESLFNSPEQPALSLPSLPSSPKSRCDASPHTPGDASVMVMPELDFSALGALQELSLEEKLELGRRRHKEYLERTRAEDDIASGVPGIAL